MKTVDVLGTPLAATTYGELTEHCVALARQPGTRAIDFANTHIVTMRRHESNFRALTQDIDMFVPDGMPLVWCLNRKGANLRDRVYGPTFMRMFLDAPANRSTHYILGSSEACAQALRARFAHVTFVGGFHGQCDIEGVLQGQDDERVIAKINALSPDFIWLGLGTPKQYGWLHRNRRRIARGVLLMVGFAFDVNAGMKKDAPMWMQKRGLTWLFRMLSEPRRLLTRYVRYNSLFVYYLAKDALAAGR